MKNDAELQAKRQDYEQRLAKAYIAAKEAGGHVPGWAEEAVANAIGVSQVPWQTQLRPLLTSLAESDYSYLRPDRRSAYRRDLIMPCPFEPGLGHAVLAVDTSGSMSQDEMNLLFPELENMIRTFPNTKLTVLQFDTRVLEDSTKEFDISNLPIRVDDWTWRGRGGTEFGPLFEYMKKQERPDVLIVVTDGGLCDEWPKQSTCPVIWLMTTDVKAPIGHTIHMRVGK